MDVVIVGAGHAGLSLSYHMKQYDLKHIVFERGCIGESWRNQRWDSFRLNSMNRLNMLPGENAGTEPELFQTAKAFADKLKNYVSQYALPVIENAMVISVVKDEDYGIFKIVVKEAGRLNKYFCRQLVIASGSQNEVKMPAFAKMAPAGLTQLHSSEFRSASILPEGAVLVIGSAQSGCQIAEDLAENGRQVYLSTSMVPRIPRRYRGKDIIDWLLTSGFFDIRTEEIKDPKVFRMTAPQLTGASGMTISLQSLATKGVKILGRMETVQGSKAIFEPNAALHVKTADEFSKNIRAVIDEYIAKMMLPAPPAESDPNDIPDLYADCTSGITMLDLPANNINTIIWATGFMKNYEYLRALFPVDGDAPAHVNGIAEIDGLYFIGLPWLRKRKSGLINGISEDAEFIARQIFNCWKFLERRRRVMSYE